jgi:DNA-binding transcriptional ArsR family regulator
MLLADKELNSGQLTSMLGISPSRLSTQIGYLRLAGIIKTRKDGRSAINSLTTLGLRLARAVEGLGR